MSLGGCHACLVFGAPQMEPKVVTLEAASVENFFQGLGVLTWKFWTHGKLLSHVSGSRLGEVVGVSMDFVVIIPDRAVQASSGPGSLVCGQRLWAGRTTESPMVWVLNSNLTYPEWHTRGFPIAICGLSDFLPAISWTWLARMRVLRADVQMFRNPVSV